MKNKLNVTGTRSILTTVDEYRAAVAEIATRAQRGLAIYTPDLEPQLYDHDLFLEPMKRLVLARSHARVRVLTRNGDPGGFGATPISVAELARVLEGMSDVRLFEPLDTGVWIAIHGDTVRSIDQQYQP